MKPIDLTRYLAKLILPPQRRREAGIDERNDSSVTARTDREIPERPDQCARRILVPFAGVGSEMIGAILAGWDEVVGIEKDEKYAAKARERIVGTAPLFLSADDDGGRRMEAALSAVMESAPCCPKCASIDIDEYRPTSFRCYMCGYGFENPHLLNLKTLSSAPPVPKEECAICARPTPDDQLAYVRACENCR